ncbi:GerAB/ArcD/ProY family transporter [Dendrosporobacter sp. 1207_IL3150]|uniref:GerAB/ArcD/ProY family transporter n=1 Tax=Dendrosporobacter sp. 1207_IL3150 TaxID=3084054 RepID=UPI002FDB8946
MSYYTGRMGAAEGFGLIFVITLPKIFLSTPGQLIEEGAGLAWLIPLIGGIAAIVPLLMLNYVSKSTPGDIIAISKKLLGKKTSWLIALFYIGIFFSNAAVLIRQFAENTLLAALPMTEFSVVIVIYGLVAGILVYLGIESLARSSYLLFPFMLVGMVLIFVLMYPLYNIYNLAPWQGNGIGAAIKAGIFTGGLNVGALVIGIFALSFQNYRTRNSCVILGLGSGLIIKSVFIFTYIMAFGVAIAQERTLPFLEAARVIYLSRYLQRIESLFILLWVIVGVLSIAISVYIAIYLIVRLLNLPTMTPLIPITILILIQLAMLPGDITTVIKMDFMLVQTYHSAGIYTVPPLLFIAALIKKRKKAKLTAVS